jgi:hypothetical protein
MIPFLGGENVSNIQMMNRSELESFVEDLKKQSEQLKEQIQQSEAKRQEAVERGDADAAMEAKEEIRKSETSIERFQIQQQAAQKRLDRFKVNEPEASKVRAQIAKVWEEARIHIEAMDQAGEAIRSHFSALKTVNNTLSQLTSQHMALVGAKPGVRTILLCERLPEFLTDHRQRKLSEYILQRGWQPLRYIEARPSRD